MSTWSYLAKFQGYRISPDFARNLDGDGALTKVSWTETIPQGTSIRVETNVSLDGGQFWEGWKTALNSGSIPDITSSTSLHNLVLKYRVFEETEDANLTPIFHDITFEFEPIIEFVNNGDVKIRPEIWITKVGNGDFSIINTSNGNYEFKFVTLIDGETVYVNGDREYIETDLALTYRYSNFNDNYLEFLRGINVLRVAGNAKIQFRHQFKTLQ